MPVVNPEGVLRARVDQPSIAAPGYTLGNRILPLVLYCCKGRGIFACEGGAHAQEHHLGISDQWQDASEQALELRTVNVDAVLGWHPVFAAARRVLMMPQKTETRQ